MMESWMISASIAVVGFIGTLAVARYVINELKSQVARQWIRLDSHYKTLLLHEGKIQTKPDMEDIRKVFVEIKMWNLQNEHMEDKLDHLEKNVMKELNTIKSAVCTK